MSAVGTVKDSVIELGANSVNIRVAERYIDPVDVSCCSVDPFQIAVLVFPRQDRKSAVNNIGTCSFC